MRPRVLEFAAVVVPLLLALLPGTVAGHAQYVASIPAANGILPNPPTSVTITFSEAVQPGTQSIRVTDVNGTRVDNSSARVTSDPRTVTVDLRPIGPGVYTVAWGAISAVDGHFNAGSFAFAVQNPDGSLPGPLPTPTSSGAPVSLAEVILRFAAFVTLAVALGGTVLMVVCWIPSGRELERTGDAGYETGFRALAIWSRLGALGFTVATAAGWVHVATSAPPDAVGSVISSPFALVIAAETVLGFALVIMLSFVIRKGKADSEEALLPILASLVIAFVAALAGPLASHGAASSRAWPLGLAADAVHVVGAYLWLGGLLAFVRLRPFLRDPEVLPLTRAVYSRFSQLAGYAVALVLAGGFVLALLLVGSFDGLFGTGYGWAVLAKALLFVPMVGLGAYNRFFVLPRARDSTHLPESVTRLKTTVRGETAIGVAVLVVAALLGAMTPLAAVNENQVFQLQATSNGIRFDFSVIPFPSVPGVYTFVIELYDAASGAPWNLARSANLTFTLQNSPLPPANATMLGPHGNHFYVDSPALSQRGTWRVDAEVTPMSGAPLSARFYIVVG